MIDYLWVSMMLRVIWFVFGIVLGLIAIRKVGNNYQNVGLKAQSLFWYQVMATPLTAFLVMWIITGLNGNLIALPWQLVMLLIFVGMTLPITAFWTLSKK